jgi:hypothetical protein
VSGVFDSLAYDRLCDMIRQRVKDGRKLHLISRGLNAGVLDGATLTYRAQGTPQGGVSSPMLANIFLHHVLDEWFVRKVKPRMKERCLLTHLADDFVISCERKDAARRIMAVLPKRLARCSLTILPTKTVLVAFRKPASQTEADMGNGTFEFLGFTHYWTKSHRARATSTRGGTGAQRSARQSQGQRPSTATTRSARKGTMAVSHVSGLGFMGRCGRIGPSWLRIHPSMRRACRASPPDALGGVVEHRRRSPPRRRRVGLPRLA